MCTAHPEDPRDGYLYSRLAPGRNFFKFNFTMVNFNYLIIYHGHFHTYFFTLNFFYLLTWDKPAVCSFEYKEYLAQPHSFLVPLFISVYKVLFTFIQVYIGM